MDSLSIITFPIVAELEQFKALFDKSLVGSDFLLNEVLNHIKQRGGKRMRPILLLLSAKLMGNITDSTYHAAIALELLHTASLVHDDVVDESDERRGQDSVNALYNNKVSILVGDYLLATCLMHSSYTGNHRIIETVAQLGRELSEGEILQLSNISNVSFDENVYFEVIRKKTASLFAACTVVGALSAGASDSQIEKMRLLGDYIGLCFQIKDDIFDYDSTAQIGKPTGNDMREGKLTLPALYVLNHTDDANVLEWGRKIKKGTVTSAEIDAFVAYVKVHGGIDYAYAKMNEFKEKALSLLAEFHPETSLYAALEAYLNYVVARSK